ncbi:hypothetical protein BU17DRAFT_98210 [Hysterangium stoloniferum]|nr:hypothetical protein BU17DRAFT_98210 [Hysterangium stoloniferum]
MNRVKRAIEEERPAPGQGFDGKHITPKDDCEYVVAIYSVSIVFIFLVPLSAFTTNIGDENDDSSDYSEDEDGAEDDMVVVKPHTAGRGSIPDANANAQDSTKPVIRPPASPSPPLPASPAKNQLSPKNNTPPGQWGHNLRLPLLGRQRRGSGTLSNDNEKGDTGDADELKSSDMPVVGNSVTADIHSDKNTLEPHNTSNSLTSVPADVAQHTAPPLPDKMFKSPQHSLYKSPRNHLGIPPLTLEKVLHAQ